MDACDDGAVMDLQALESGHHSMLVYATLMGGIVGTPDRLSRSS